MSIFYIQSMTCIRLNTQLSIHTQKKNALIKCLMSESGNLLLCAELLKIFVAELSNWFHKDVKTVTLKVILKNS